MAGLQEYIELLEEDPKLREALKTEPLETITAARIPFEDKRVLRSGDPDAVARAAGVSSLSEETREAIREAGRRLAGS